MFNKTHFIIWINLWMKYYTPKTTILEKAFRELFSVHLSQTLIKSIPFNWLFMIASSCRWSFHLLWGLLTMSETILLKSCNCFHVSASSSTSMISSFSFSRPVKSSLLCAKSTSSLSILSLLKVEVWSSWISTQTMWMFVLLTSCRSTSCL